MVYRRKFIKSLMIANLAPIFFGPTFLASLKKEKDVFEAGTFSSLIGKRVHARTKEGEHVQFTLEDVTSHVMKGDDIPSDVQRNSISCLWKIKSGDMQEGVVLLDHPELGPMHVHFFPKWEEDGQRLYESIWN